MKTKVPTIEKVYLAAKKLFKVGKPLPVSAIAKAVKKDPETVRQNVLKLVKGGYIKRDKQGHIINVK